MVWAREIDHLEVKEFPLEVGWIPECDEEPNAPEREGLDSRNDPKEGGFARAEALPWHPHAVQRASLENIEAAPPSISTYMRWACPTMGPTMSRKRPELGTWQG